MNAKQITAIVVVVGLLAVGIVGAGYAFQAQYTDQITGQGEATGQFLKAVDKEGVTTKAISLENTAAKKTVYLDAGVDITKTASTPSNAYEYKWDGTSAIISETQTGGDMSGTYAYDIPVADKAANKDSIHVKVLYYLGAVDVTAPQDGVDGATVSVAPATAWGTASVSGTNITAGTANAYYVLVEQTNDDYAEGNAWKSVTESVTSVSSQTIGTEASTYLLYCVASYVINAPTSATPTVTLSLEASTATFTVTAPDFAPATP